MAAAPTAEDLRAYTEGNLAPARFAVVDAWLATQDPAEQERVLAAATAGAGAHAAVADAHPAFATSGGHGRYRIDGELGRGGMGMVLAGTDLALGRPVAIKILLPRAAEEPLARYALRQQWFEREATLLAGLDHPGIVSIHDVGRGPHGEPAYIMRRLEGAPVRTLVDQAAADIGPGPARAAEIVQRAAEAVGAAHARGIVHRDLKPDNIWAGPRGDVVVIDWGLAVRCGETLPGADGAGTKGWMSPEQHDGANADPRADVYALGGVLQALITGIAPVDAIPDRRLPRGLAAVVRRCRHRDPAQRYADGDALAADLARWFAAGITQAEQPGWPRRLQAWVRLQPGRAVAATAFVALISAALVLVMTERTAASRAVTEEVARLVETTSVNDRGALSRARARVNTLRQRHGDRPSLRAAEARLQAAESLLQERDATVAQRQRLRALARRFDLDGPWPNEAEDLRRGLIEAGITPGHAEARGHLLGHAAEEDVRRTLVHLARVLILADAPMRERAVITDLIAAGGDPAWRAMAELLRITRTRAHDLIFCECAHSEIVLASRSTADLLLALFGPEPRLVAAAQATISDDPGAFWPRVILARAAIAARDAAEARSHALVALGAEPTSLWPALQLAYAALLADDAAALTTAVATAARANPVHAEVVLLQAVVQARGGDRSGARVLAERVGAAHLRYHLDHPVGHPMELAARALVTAGIDPAPADAALGPLVTPHH